MSMYKDDRGVLFVNTKKNKDTQPDYTGGGKVGGTEYRISGWIRDGKAGRYLSLAFSLKDQPAGEQISGGVPDIIENIPF